MADHAASSGAERFATARRAADRRALAASIAAGLVAAAAILTAWGFQLIGGYVPCALCLDQRVPYYVGIPVLVAAVVAAWRAPGSLISRLLLVFAAAIFAYSFTVAVYQAGAEWMFWPGPTDCGGGTGPVADASNLLATLQKTHLVSCTEASGRFLGLSFAGWNAVATGGVILLSLWGAFSPRYRRAGAAPKAVTHPEAR